MCIAACLADLFWHLARRLIIFGHTKLSRADSCQGRMSVSTGGGKTKEKVTERGAPEDCS